MVNLEEAPAHGREESVELVATLLDHFCGDSVLGIETGVMRNTGENYRIGDGWSTLFWAWYFKQRSEDFISVDTNLKNIIGAREFLKEKGVVDNIQFICSDSVRYLNKTINTFNLAYLDSLGPDEEGIDFDTASLHQLNEVKEIIPKMREAAFIILDDVPENFDTGKCKYSVKCLTDSGWQIVLHHKGTTQMVFTNIIDLLGRVSKLHDRGEFLDKYWEIINK